MDGSVFRHARAVTMRRPVRAGFDHAESHARFRSAREDCGEADASVGALSRVPAQALPGVPMATPVDPIFTAIERDRIAYVAFAASLNKTDGRKAAQQKGREVTQADEDAHEAASGVGDDAVK
jgi:hypothetical protein